MSGRWVPGADVLVRRTGETAVIVDLTTNRIFELNPVGARVWELLASGADEASLLRQLGEEFEAGADELARDVHDLLAALQREKLIAPA
jgi:hypothetical protein